MNYNFERYQQFISQVDELAEKLSTLHHNQMQCRKGCDLCCMNYRIFPVEYYAIQQSLNDKPVETAGANDNSCIFLKDSVCQVYAHRPFICRTHGLPLLYLNEEQWELSACELNFREFDDEEFSAENTFPQDSFNSVLFQINKAFIQANQLSYSEFDLLEIKDLHPR
ncbi:YkgJ family cysteine cluster protein [Mangrovibacterium marinum]|uniref:Fe-S-cluster containining protein n=1 Tax=Mangrovibacterium marinum TaxID=1639118 RepID=A0A2T5C3W3_9BACT|nr:YkgJ family cysteine cluster protein [Mangrovibacterium marinum]PTN09501.1 Fe-S-cluster containining protein [Mangrovibacterium marinum]